MERLSTFFGADCASVTFDRAGRIVSVCVGLDGPRLVMFDPRTLDLLAEFPLPPRQPGAANPFTDFSGGGYFYLDNHDRAVIPTTTATSGWSSRPGPLGPGFELERDYDVSGACRATTVSRRCPTGRAGSGSSPGRASSARSTGSRRDPTLDTGEQIRNSFAVDETGGVYIVTDAALYRFEPAPAARPRHLARAVPEHRRPQAGPDRARLRHDTDADGPGVRRDHRQRRPDERRRLQARRDSHRARWSARSRSSSRARAPPTIADRRRCSLIVENNYGYTGPTATTEGATTTPGLQRVDINEAATGCRTVWRSTELAPSVVPKLSLATGLVYTYTKPADADGTDAWYFTALDFRTGARSTSAWPAPASASTTTTRPSRSARTAPPTWARSAASCLLRDR